MSTSVVESSWEVKTHGRLWVGGKRIEGSVSLGLEKNALVADGIAPRPFTVSLFPERDSVGESDVLAQARSFFDTLDPDYDAQLDDAQRFLTSKGVEHKLTSSFRDLLVPSGVDGHFHIVGFNRFAEAELHEPARKLAVEACTNDVETAFRVRVAELAKKVLDLGGRVSLEHNAVHLSASGGKDPPSERTDSPRWVFFFHKLIWKFYDRAPVVLLDLMQWVLENVTGSHVSIFLDDRNVSAEWDRQLSTAPPTVLMDLSHGRLVDNQSTILAGTDRFGRPTEVMTADFLKTSLSRSEIAPRWLLFYACHSLETDAISKVFLEAGSTAVVGWNERTAAFADKVDQVCTALLPNARANNQTFADSVASMIQQQILPVDVVGTSSSLVVHGDSNVRWWD